MSINTGRESLEEQIRIIASSANKLPGVIIIHDLKEWTVCWMCDKGLQGLGISLEEVQKLSAAEYASRYFSDEESMGYIPMIVEMLERNSGDEMVTFFQKVRIKGKSDWIWHMSSTRIFMRDEEGKPSYLITISFPIDAMHHMSSKADRLLEESQFLRRNFQRFSKLSLRECEVLKLLALGKSSAEIAGELFISLGTVDTHRKNI